MINLRESIFSQIDYENHSDSGIFKFRPITISNLSREGIIPAIRKVRYCRVYRKIIKNGASKYTNVE